MFLNFHRIIPFLLHLMSLKQGRSHMGIVESLIDGVRNLLELWR